MLKELLQIQLAIGRNLRRRRIEPGIGEPHTRQSFFGISVTLAATDSDKCGVGRECDSPLRLTNYTLDFLEKNWASQIDFVICKWGQFCYIVVPMMWTISH